MWGQGDGVWRVEPEPHSGWRGCDVPEGLGLTVTGSGGDMDLVGEFSVGDVWLWLQAIIPIVTLERQVHY